LSSAGPTEFKSAPESGIPHLVAVPSGMIAESIDRQAIIWVIWEWGMFRDGGHWDLLSALYSPGAIMVTTWFRGGADEFVRLSAAAAIGFAVKRTGTWQR